MSSRVPSFLISFYSYFPLISYPSLNKNKSVHSPPTLWILPPRQNTLLSTDVECLKWQAYLALRGLTNIRLRWDIAPEGSISGSLPNLHISSDEGGLLPAHAIPAWVDAKLGSSVDLLEGYKDQAAMIESRAWVSLLEGIVHATLILYQPPPSYLRSILFPSSTTPLSETLQKILSPPPAPLSGLCSFLPPFGTRVSTPAILSSYRDAIGSLSQRLGTDKWFLGSNEPTPLDALAFAYLHCLLHTHDTIRIEVTRRVNLVAWEWRVRCQVLDKFTQ